MTRLRPRRLGTWFAVLALSVTGCGSSGSGGEGGNEANGGGIDASAVGADEDASVTIDVPAASDAVYDVAPVGATVPLAKAPWVFAEVVCEKVYACCTDGERADNPLITSQAGCSAVVSSLLAGLVPQAADAVAKGRAMYDPAALATCLKEYQEATCTEARVSGGLSALHQCHFIVPLVAVGGACQQNLECADGFCTGASAATDGKCVAQNGDGHPCTDDDECKSGACTKGTLVCGPAVAQGLCAAL